MTHIIRSSSNAFAFASADEVLSNTIDLTETNRRLVASIEQRINDCNAVIGDIAFAPRDCKIDRVGLEVVATAGCYCDGPEIAVPIRAARLYLKVDGELVILTILNDEVFLDSEE